MYGLHIRQVFGGCFSLDHVVVANSTAIAIGDPVVRDTDGFLIVCTAGLRVEGIADQAFASDADNETVDMATCAFIPANSRDLYEADADDTLTASYESGYMDLVGTTGIVQMDVGTFADETGSFRLVHRDPRGESSTTRGLWNIAEPESLAYTQN